MKLLLYKPLTQVTSIILLVFGITFLLFGCSSLIRQDKDSGQSNYKIEIVSLINDIKPNQEIAIVYKIKDKQGNIVKDFDVMNEKIMHFIVIRKDLQYFQHLHPEFDKTTGEFSIPVTFPTDGKYRIFADFMPSTNMKSNGKHQPITIYKDVNVGSLADYKSEPLGSTNRTKTFDDYSIKTIPNSEPLLSQNDYGFTFEIKKDKKLVTNLEKYLGALGHTVVIREGDLQFIHAHPTQSFDVQQTGKVTFMITFPKVGNYKLFSQFKHEGKIITSDFLVSVSAGIKNSTGSMMVHKGMK